MAHVLFITRYYAPEKAAAVCVSETTSIVVLPRTVAGASGTLYQKHNHTEQRSNCTSCNQESGYRTLIG